MENFVFTKKSKLHQFWSKAITKKKSSKVINEAVQKETIDSVTESDKTDKPQSSAEPCHATTAVTPAQDKVKQRINTENKMLVGLYRKQYLGQLSQRDQKEVASRGT